MRKLIAILSVIILALCLLVYRTGKENTLLNQQLQQKDRMIDQLSKEADTYKKASDAQYDKGYDFGKSIGYTHGYEEGYEEGYAKGKSWGTTEKSKNAIAEFEKTYQEMEEKYGNNNP